MEGEPLGSMLVDEERGEDSGVGQRERLSCDSVRGEASLDPVGSQKGPQRCFMLHKK